MYVNTKLIIFVLNFSFEIKDLYQTIFDMPLEENAILFLIVTLFSSYLITFAYHNIAFSLRNKYTLILQKKLTKF